MWYARKNLKVNVYAFQCITEKGSTFVCMCTALPECQKNIKKKQNHTHFRTTVRNILSSVLLKRHTLSHHPMLSSHRGWGWLAEQNMTMLFRALHPLWSSAGSLQLSLPPQSHSDFEASPRALSNWPQPLEVSRKTRGHQLPISLHFQASITKIFFSTVNKSKGSLLVTIYFAFWLQWEVKQS